MSFSDEKNILFSAPGGLDLPSTLDCGQAFRWQPAGEGYVGVAYGQVIRIKAQRGDNVCILGADQNDYDNIWRSYFDLDRDYAAIRAAFTEDEFLHRAFDYCRGMRILNQQPWETLISFIISANNNVRRIRGIIENICTRWGAQIMFENKTYFSFPDPSVLAKATEQELIACGAGYRAPFILQSARDVAEGFPLDALRYKSTAEARAQLISLKGVGPKVADCIMLFSLGFTQAFPVDRWMDRVMQHYLGERCSSKELQEHIGRLFGQNAGIAQQYLFHYVRNNPAACGYK